MATCKFKAARTDFEWQAKDPALSIARAKPSGSKHFVGILLCLLHRPWHRIFSDAWEKTDKAC